MPETQNNNSLSNIEFPRQILLIKRLRFFSFLINDIVLFSSLIAIIYSIATHLGVNISILSAFNYQPVTPVLFIICGIILLFGAKRHQLSTDRDDLIQDEKWWNIWIPILLAGATASIGALNYSSVLREGIFTFLYMSPFAGFCFFLIGVALVPPFTNIPHRFHVTQSLIFIVSGLSMFIVLETFYQQFFLSTIQQIIRVPFLTALFFAFFCFGVLLRWSNRGFFGNFTLNSTISMFAFRLLLTNLILGPILAFIVLFAAQTFPLNTFQVVAIVVALIAFATSTLIWLNIRFLYRYELENLLMRESLRMHNIDLQKETTTLAGHMAQLEKDKQSYVEKLNSKNGWQDAVDRLGG